jgi:UDP-2,3-diacylglucosamine pyrophosphatase LpxH
MKKEGRLLRSLIDPSGPGPFYSNFRTKLPFASIVSGQQRVLESIYEPRVYLERLLEAYRRLPRERTAIGRFKKFLFPSGMVLGSGARSSVKALPQMSGKARVGALLRFLRSVEKEYRREALRFMGKMIRERPEHFQQSLDYLIMGYHYHRFTRDTVAPEYEQVLRKYSSAPAA